MIYDVYTVPIHCEHDLQCVWYLHDRVCMPDYPLIAIKPLLLCNAKGLATATMIQTTVHQTVSGCCVASC
jgi:hypothetical protein